MDGKIVKLLKDLSDRVQDTHRAFLAGNGGYLESITLSKDSFDMLDEAMSESGYWKTSGAHVPGWACGNLWGVPIITDPSMPDDEVRFNMK